MISEWVQCQAGEYVDGRAVRCTDEGTVLVTLPDMEHKVDVCERHAKAMENPLRVSTATEDRCPTCDGKGQAVNALTSQIVPCPTCH